MHIYTKKNNNLKSLFKTIQGKVLKEKQYQLAKKQICEL